MMMKTNRRQFFAAAVLIVSACYSRNAAQQANQPAAVLTVDNQGVLDMTVYVFRGAERVRLGIAGALKKTDLPIPADMIFGASTLRFVGDPIGSNRNSVSDQITVSPGDTVTWTVRPNG